jgi:hypothetical protein
MGACADLWQDEIERITDEYAAGKLDRDEAMKELWRKGLSAQEASDLLAEAIS